MKKLLSIFLTVVLIITVMPLGAFEFKVSAATSGTTGDCTWSLNGTTLTISGNGKMGDYYQVVSAGADSDLAPISTPWGTYITDLIIEEGVTELGLFAFYNCYSLENIHIKSLAAWCNMNFYIHDPRYYYEYQYHTNPFYYAENLYLNGELVTDLIIPDSVTSIGSYAFYDCDSLTSVTISDSATSIGYDAFVYCKSLTSVTIGDSVTSIGSSAFSYCSSLTSITIGNGVTSIGSSAFYNTGYYNNSNNWENGVLYIGNHLIKAETSLSGSYEIKAGTVTIADYAFYYCSNLTSVSLGDSVTSIGNGAFYNTGYYNNSSNWENGVLYIGNHLIKAKTSISGSYEIKAGTITIAGNAFYDCSSLTSIIIPDSVTSIGSSAFTGCSSLTSIAIPDSVTSIGYDAFYNTGYYNNSNNWENGVLYIGNCLIDANTSLSGSYEIKAGTIIIADYAFYNCDSLTSITIPDSVTSIGDYAFEDCSNLKTVYYCGKIKDKNNIIIGIHNGYFIDARWYYYWCVDGEYQYHTYDDSFDTDCNICGFTRSAPELAYKYSGTVALVATDGFEYSLDGENWQASNVFTNLSENATYNFYQRIAGSDEETCLTLNVTIKTFQSTPTAPIVLGYSDTIIQLLPQSDMEYSLDGTTWQTSNIFRNLSPVTEYTLYQRLAETETSEASGVSEVKTFKTAKAEQILIPPAPTVLEVTENSVTLNPVEGCEYSKDGTRWQSNNVFNNLRYSSEYTFYQRYAATETTDAGKKSEGITVKTLKGTASRPYYAPTLVSKTYNSVTLEGNHDYYYDQDEPEFEFSMDGINWQKSNVFTGLLPKMYYTFYQRIAETDEHYASAASPSLVVKTDAAPERILGDISGDEKTNLNDLVLLAQYVAGWENLFVDTAALDINGDGTINLNDVTHFARYLSGWDVQIF